MRQPNPSPKRGAPLSMALACCLALTACTAAPEPPPQRAPNLARLEPRTGTYVGVNLDWSVDSPASYNQRLEHHAAVFVQFVRFPMEQADILSLSLSAGAVASEGGMLLVTLEPWDGLEGVTADAASALARELAAANAANVPVLVRFAHEMNGSWYPWSQQPEAYVPAYRIVAEAVHRGVPEGAMLWAPNYGGGYPFAGGQYAAAPGSAPFHLLDTNNDGRLDTQDDPYAPYYPGDDAVDWVGMSLYHWGGAYPWGENEIPEDGKFLAQLTGTYRGLNGDDSGLPDFYAIYHGEHGKPVAIPETAAFYDPAGGGAVELQVKRAWWRQVFNPDLLRTHDGIKMINWFEWVKAESEVGGRQVDWRALSEPVLADQYRADLPLDELIFAP